MCSFFSYLAVGMLRNYSGTSACEIKSLPQQMYQEKREVWQFQSAWKEVLWPCSLVITMRKTTVLLKLLLYRYWAVCTTHYYVNTTHVWTSQRKEKNDFVTSPHAAVLGPSIPTTGSGLNAHEHHFHNTLMSFVNRRVKLLKRLKLTIDKVWK